MPAKIKENLAMKNKKGYIILGLIICIFTFSVMTINSNLNESAVATSASVLSNKKITAKPLFLLSINSCFKFFIFKWKKF